MAPTTIPVVAGRRLRFALAAISITLAGAAVTLLFGDWALRCPETQASGFLDCGGQPDAEWHSAELPGWVSLYLLFGAALIGAAGLAFAVILELRSRRVASIP